jgi:hypothetical protein
MIVKTLRDAELAINSIERRLDQVASRSLQSGVSLDEVRALIKRSQSTQVIRQEILTNTSQFDLTDIDATPSEGQIIHRLIHLFYEEVRFARSLRLVDGWFYTADGLRQWKTNVGFDNPIGGSDPNYQIRWLDSVTPALNYRAFIDPGIGLCLDKSIIPLTDNAGDLGNTSLRWNTIWAGTSINLTGQTTNPNFSGNFFGTTASGAVRQFFSRGRGTIATPADVAVGDFLGIVAFRGYNGGSFRNACYIQCEVEAIPSGSSVAGKFLFITTNASGVTDGRWEILATGNFVPFVNNTVDIGSSAKRVKKLWAVDIDFSGTITGSLPGVDTNSELNANCSSLLTLTTTFADVAGVSVSLNKNGKWLINCNVDGTKTLNDDDIQGQLVYDGVAQSGLIRMGTASTIFLRSTGSRSWIINVTGQPKTAKLQAKKVTGTGTSYVDTNTNIVAVYLST